MIMDTSFLPNNSNPLISVIIPCYNSALYVTETLNSILAQTMNNYEIVIIDDGSTDNTLLILKQFAQQHSQIQIKIIEQENTNVTIARVNAIKHASGVYLFFLDSDDKIAPTYFEKAANLLNQQPELSLIYSRAQHFEANTNEIWCAKNPTVLDILQIHCMGNGICMMVRKKDYDEVGGFNTDLTYGEDWEFYISMLKKNKKFYQIDEILYFYRKRNTKNSICDSVDKKKIARNFLKIYTKHIDFYEENNMYFHNLFDAFHQQNWQQQNLEFFNHKKKYYSNPLRKWFYKTFKSKKYEELRKKYDIN
ncbi:glycosyltransferase [Kingella kingae]|nr:glycosyltransferase [Kingella kingae]MBD3632630.1 glycosyltransferase [Kingella kingae]MBD3660023.1 glycosyltransferase [Kingella kingae]QIF41678.1 glycosyltransferase [Kingella kingae]QIP51495.1 glycosyltransferase [Kingella kingae]